MCSVFMKVIWQQSVGWTRQEEKRTPTTRESELDLSGEHQMESNGPNLETFRKKIPPNFSFSHSFGPLPVSHGDKSEVSMLGSYKNRSPDSNSKKAKGDCLEGTFFLCFEMQTEGRGGWGYRRWLMMWGEPRFVRCELNRALCICWLGCPYRPCM